MSTSGTTPSAIGACPTRTPLFTHTDSPTAQVPTLPSHEKSLMTHRTRWRTRSHEWLRTSFSAHSRAGCLALLLSLACCSALAESARAQEGPREAYIPILFVTTGDKPTGMVIYLMVLFAKRDDAGSLDAHFLSGPGRFSEKAKTATRQAITGAARAMGLSPDA